MFHRTTWLFLLRKNNGGTLDENTIAFTTTGWLVVDVKLVRAGSGIALITNKVTAQWQEATARSFIRCSCLSGVGGAVGCQALNGEQPTKSEWGSVEDRVLLAENGADEIVGAGVDCVVAELVFGSNGIVFALELFVETRFDLIEERLFAVGQRRVVLPGINELLRQV